MINENNENIIKTTDNETKKEVSSEPLLIDVKIDNTDLLQNTDSIINESFRDKVVCCFKRRKIPEKKHVLFGIKISSGLLLGEAIILSICLGCSNLIPVIDDSTKFAYKIINVTLWLSTLICLGLMFDIFFSSPGRQRGYQVPEEVYKNAQIKKIVGGESYTLKYCVTCHVIRDVRTFHCNNCGLCVEKHDHHCGYLSNCIGVYNYKKFFFFLIISFLHITFVFGTCVHYLSNYITEAGKEYLWISILIILCLGIAGFFDFFMFWMIIQHLTIIVQNRTTREIIKDLKFKPYNRGCKYNCYESLCRNNIKEM